MANGLIPRKRNRDFFQNLLPPEQGENEGLFGLGRYQPLPEFETPRQQALAPAPGMLRLGQGNLAPAPMLQRPREAIVTGGDIPGVSTGTFTGEPILAPAPGVKRPEPRAPAPIPSYGEEYRREHERPEAPERKGIGWKRGLLAVGLGTLAGMGGDSGAAARTAENVLYGPYRRKYAGYERDVEEYEGGLEEARERDIGEGRRIQRELGQERLTRLRQTPIPGQDESEAEAFERKRKEAEILGLEVGSPEYLEYVSERDLGFAPRQPERYTRTLPGGESELLERRPGEDYYRPAQMLALGVEEIAPPITLEHGGVGGQPLELPGPRPPTERVVSYPRPTRPSARDVSTEQQRVVARLAREAMRNAGNDTAKAIQDVNDSVDQGMLDPALLDDLIRMILLQARGRTRGRGGVEDEVADALQGIVQE